MTTRENYVYQTFNSELSKYPVICQKNIRIPSCDDFGIDFVDPQYNPLKIKDEMPDYYNKLHRYIIENHLNLYSKRYVDRIDKNLYNFLSSLEIDKLKNVINKCLILVGKTHNYDKHWSFLDNKYYKQSLRSRAKKIREDLIHVIRKSLDDLAFRSIKIPHDVHVLMRILLNEDI